MKFDNNMNYIKLYVKLVKKIKQRNPEDIVGELHHVFPKSIYGENNYLIKVTYKEHYVLHHLLWKLCTHRYGIKHPYTIKMCSAFYFMTTHPNHKNRLTSKQYETLRKQYVTNISNLHKGVPKSEEANLKRSLFMKEYNSTTEVISKLKNNGLIYMSNPSNREYLSKIKSKRWKIILDTSEVIIVENLYKWCKENNYSHSHIIRVANGERKTHKNIIQVKRLSPPRKGVTKNIQTPITVEEEYYKLKSPDGNEYVLNGTFKEFGEIHNLKPKRLSKLCRGVIPMYKGWTLIE